MKQIGLLTTAAIFLIVFAACKNNKLKVNEDTAKSKLLEQEAVIAEQKRIEEEKAKAFADSIAKLPKALRVKADRSIDKKRPPVVFDIEKARAIVKPIKYSQLGKKVSYVKLSHQFDKDFTRNLAVKLTGKYIITQSLGGIVCYNNDGTLKEVVARNGKLYEIYDNTLISDTEKWQRYTGTMGMPFAICDKLYYQYADNPNKQGWLMEYDMNQPKKIFYNNGENLQNKPIGTRKAPITVAWKLMTGESILPLDKYHWTTDKSKWNSSKAGYFISVQNFSGDTVCQLKDYDPVRNFTASVYQTTHNKLYRLNSHLYFRQVNNDTIYRFETVNRVRPLYVIDFGKKKIKSSTDRLNPWFDTRDKYILKDIIETNQFVFVFYTKDYACEKALKQKTIQFSCFAYNKLTGEQFHTYVAENPIVTQIKKSKNYSRLAPPPPLIIEPPLKGIINDLDYGITTWKWKLAEDGRLYKLLSGKQIKEYVKNNPKNSNLANKELLEEIADKAKDDDLFIMIISN